ncbi:MAG: rhodanese-related sulfurtransferase [Mariniblastus sp.]|jgi:rhodanese-related sulfurtransferase
MNQTPAPFSSDGPELPIEIDVETVKQLLASKTEDSELGFHFIDCRETSESELCKIEGAQLIPMNETPNRLEELEMHRKSRIVVHCHHGGRSLQVVQYLRSQGFSLAQNMTGGIDGWSCQIDESIPRY